MKTYKAPCVCELAPTRSIPFASKRTNVYDRLYVGNWQPIIVLPTYSTASVGTPWLVGTLVKPVPTEQIQFSSRLLQWQS